MRVYLQVSCHGPCSPVWHPSWNLSPFVSLIIITTSRESLPISVLEGNKAGKMPEIMNHNSTHAGSLHVMGTVYQTQSQGYGNSASLSYPDTWVRKSDCLHLPYQSLVHCWWECRLVQPLWKTVWNFLRKLRMELPFDPAIVLLGLYLKNPETPIQKNLCTPMFIAAQFTIAKYWKQPKCPSANEWIQKP